jgi:hypothetical protein
MYIYNVTVKVDWSIHDAWLQWMKEEHMKEVTGTGCFTHHRLLRLLDVDDSDGPTYAAQYFAESKAACNKYLEVYAPALRTKGTDKWGNRFVAFRSLMEVVD